MALACSTLLSACGGATAPLVPSNPGGYQLSYGLGSEALLLVHSPDLERRLTQYSHRPPRLDFATAYARNLETTDLPDDLKIELSSPERDKQSKVMFHFAEQGRLLDQASLDTKILAHTWLLGLNADIRPQSAEMTDRSFFLQSEFSGLLGRRQTRPFAAAGPRSRLATPQGIEGSAEQPASWDESRPRESTSLALGAAAPAPRPYYLAFHDASLATDSEGTVNFLFSFGGFPGEDYGEVVTTYRLLSWNRSPGGTNAERESFEQAVAIGYRGTFSHWVKSFGHTLTYFDDRGDAPERADSIPSEGEALAKAGNYQQWQSRVELSCGDDLRWPARGILQGYRLDFHLETQTALQRSGLLSAKASRAGAAWGSQLRLKTVFGTLSGRLNRSANQHRLALGLQKTGLAGARVKLYYEDIDYRSLGELETRIGGQLSLPLDETLLQVLSLGYWRNSEARLFAARPARGYTAPRRGQHVPTLNNATPGTLQ